MLKVLMIEDDIELAELLQKRLLKDDIDVKIALTPLEGLEHFKKEKFNLLILDLSLPQIDGHTICRLIRKESDIPIIISSARSGIDDKKLAFEYGADDYLPKPYNPDELVFRIDAIIRRLNKETRSFVQPFEVDTLRGEILKEGLLLRLSPAEYEILTYMISKDRGVVTREELLLNIPSIKYESSLKSIDVIIGRVRLKIGDDPKNPRYILAVRGKGYKFVNQ